MAHKGRNRRLKPEQRDELIAILKARFEKNTGRHRELRWGDVEKRLALNPEKLWSLREMERTGGEPDVTGLDGKTGEFVFIDCSPESPAGRRNLCYDPDALKSRKEHKPAHSALGMAADMGVDVLTEEEYRALQDPGRFDTKTSSWIRTPDSVRKLGGALFCDRRYDRVFVYHNGAESYYGSRGFRGRLKV